MSKYTLATMYGVGLAKKAPGTWGSLVAAILAYFVLTLSYGWLVAVAGVVLSTYFGTKSATRYMREHDCGHDPREIVIDEFAGQWLTYVIGCFVARIIGCHAGGSCGFDLNDGLPDLPEMFVLGFLCFRLCDIFKPWPICLADEKIKGGWGVMFDDLLAAIPAALLLVALMYLYAVLLG